MIQTDDPEALLALAEQAIARVRELHSRGQYGECLGCDGRCGCFEGDIADWNKWETCPTIQALDGEQ